LPIIDDETFESALSLLYGTLRHQSEKHDVIGDEDELLLALFANPMTIDSILAQGLARTPTELMLALGSYERKGLLSRYPDGRYGPSAKALGG
jgi:hypothetical protein